MVFRVSQTRITRFWQLGAAVSGYCEFADVALHWRALQIDSVSSTEHSLYSTYRESLLEHLFAGEVMRHLWLSGLRRVEVLKPQVDDGGYDLVLEAGGVVRHVQLKATFKGSTIKSFKVNLGLASKPSGCVICVLFDQGTLTLGPFYWFGGSPGQKLPGLSAFKVAKHTKGNAQGVKTERPNLRVLPLSEFQPVADMASLTTLLFGPLSHVTTNERLATLPLVGP